MNWFAIHTKPRQEASAEEALAIENIETFFPKLRRRKIIRRKMQWSTRPLFPSYFFARFDFIQSHRLVRYSAGVTNIVSFGGKPTIVDNEIVETIRAHAEEDIVTIPPKKFQPGDLVQIHEGPLRGLEGIFDHEMNDSERVVILLQIVAKRAHVEVEREYLQKA